MVRETREDSRLSPVCWGISRECRWKVFGKSYPGISSVYGINQWQGRRLRRNQGGYAINKIQIGRFRIWIGRRYR